MSRRQANAGRTALYRAVRFLKTPGDIPQGTAFYILRDAEYDEATESLIRPFLGSADLRGYVNVQGLRSRTLRWTMPRNAPVLISSRRWPDLIERLVQAGCRPENVWVLLKPVAEAVGYWDFGRSLGENLAELADPSIPLDRKLVLARKHLEEWGFTRYVDGNPVWLPECYFAQFSDRVARDAEKIRRVIDGLVDDQSRRVYLRALLGTPEELFSAYLDNVFRCQQYTELVELPDHAVIVNGGVGAGWELPYFVAMTGGSGKIYSFDPAAAWGHKWAHLDNQVLCDSLPECFEFVQAALWDEYTSTSFPMQGDGQVMSGRPQESIYGCTDVTVPCVNLDQYAKLNGFDRIDYVKLDLEGGEPRALAGMRESLVRFRPQLAVSIYHEPEHMWDLPLMLMALLPDYEFHVRHYGYFRFEVVLYGIPRERIVRRELALVLQDDRGDQPYYVPRAAIYFWSCHGSEQPKTEAGPNIPGLRLAATGRFTPDSRSDVVAYDPSSGKVLLGLMVGRKVREWVEGPVIPGLEIRGTGPFGGVSGCDLVAQDPSSGEIYFGLMDGVRLCSWVTGPTTPGATLRWSGRLRGQPCLLVQQAKSGECVLWTRRHGSTGCDWISGPRIGALEAIGIAGGESGAPITIVARDADSGAIAVGELDGDYQVTGWTKGPDLAGFRVVATSGG